MVTALAAVLAVPAGLSPVAQAAQAADGGPGRPVVPKPREGKVKELSAPGARKARERVAQERAGNASDAARASQQQRAHWPGPGTATMSLTGTSARATVGGIPVTVKTGMSAKPARTVAGQASISVLDRKTTKAAGVRGVLLTAQTNQPGKAELTVDYASFASAIGGGWSSRLRLSQLPACALTTPKLAKCRTLTPLNSRNAVRAQSLSAAVSLAAPTVLAVTASGPGPSPSGAGDYSATPLASSSTWEAGGSSGSFTWSYPMDAPKAAAGPSPSLNLTYDSGSIDGRTAATNNQGTSVGEGFDLSTVSYIERNYGSCDKDGHDKQYDLCWKYENASLVLNGRSTELVKDDITGKWRLKNDDASTVAYGTGAANGDDNGEHWTVTTGDGTKYVFGLNKLSGAGTERTNSVWTAPVFGDDTGEPGYTQGDAFGDRWLNQAWRWNLDYVEDTHGNAMSYWYTAETNHYRRNKAGTANAAYTPGGYLNKILYGQRSDTLFTAEAPGRVNFTYAERCTVSNCSPLGDDTSKNWPDIPYDAICASGANDIDCLAESPAFFSRKRLTKIDTAVYSGTAYTPVDSWAFTQNYADNGDIADSSDQTLRLDSIQRTGHTGTAITLDPVSFTYLKRPNRVAGGTQPGGGNILPLTRPRVSTITSEAGAITTVTYNDPECVRGSRMPAAEDSNAESCYPQYWNINGATDATLDWFHKYRVTAVTTADPSGSGELVENAYTYEDPAWHFNDSPFVAADERTWSIWRGYQKVTVQTGASTGTRSRTVTSYLQGMHGDPRKAGGTRSVNVPGIDFSGLDVPDAVDADQYAGFTRQQITYNGGSPVGVTVNTPWSARTATQHKSYADIESYFVRTGTQSTHTYLTVPKTWRTARAIAKYDTYGMAYEVDNTGDIADGNDDTCTRTWYARNDARGINSLVSRTRTVGRVCAIAEEDLKLPASAATREDVLSDTAIVYDNADATAWSTGQTLTKGEATWTGRASAYPATTTGGERHPSTWQTMAKATYDTLGRPRRVTDTAGRPTTTDYTPVGAGILTKTIVTNPKTHKTITFLDGVRGLPLRTYDANSKKTEQTYDGLGRLTGVWLPNRSKDGGQSASMTFAYTLKRGVAPSIATSTIKSSDTVTTSYAIFDSLLRPLQTQSPTPNGGRLLTDTRYDSRGLAYETYADIYDTAKTPNGTYARAEYGGAPKQIATVFDGAGRATSSSFHVFGVKKWTTTTSYTGDSTATSAVSGGQATRVITDALGRAVERREYAGPDPADAAYGGGLGVPYTSTSFTYTRDAQQDTITGPDGAKWSYTYDLFGRQVSATDPDKGTSKTEYTALDQVDWTEDSAGKRVLYGYDELGRKTGLWSSARTDANKLAAWTFDTLAKGYGDSSTRYDGGATGKAYTKKIVTYDTLYRPTKTQLLLDANEPLVLAGAAQTSYTFEGAFNLDGTVQNSTEPAAGGLPAETIENRYTPTGQPTAVYSGTSGYLQGASYSELGLPQQLTLGVSASAEAKMTYVDNRYEPGTDRLTRSFVTTPQTAPYKPQDLSYVYDDAGNVTKIADTPNAAPALATDIQCFAYDGQRRLTEAWTPSTDDCTSKTLGGPAPYRNGYTYNTAGQRATETVTPVTGAATTTNYCYTSTSQRHTLTATKKTPDCTGVTPGYGYDKTGNTTKRSGPTGVTQDLTWNAEGKIATLAEGAKKTSYLYDAEGTLLIRRAGGDGESVLYLGATEIHHKVAGTSKKTWATRAYAAGPQTIALRTNESGTSKLSFLAGDHHGTGSLALDATTQAITKRFTTPFGAPRGGAVGTWPDDKAFLGKPADTTTGLTHIGAREYDPGIGQFISVDPVLAPDQHQSLNGYAYANNAPVTSSDPSGLFCDGCSANADNSAWQPSHGPGCTTEGCYDTSGNITSGGGTESTGGTASGGGGGTSSDGQPMIDGIRMPPYKELSNYAAGYADQDTYGYRIEKWAKNNCSRPDGPSSNYVGFCGTAKAAGLLEVGDDPFGVKVVGRCVFKGENCGEAAVTVGLYLVGAGVEWAAARRAAASSIAANGESGAIAKALSGCRCFLAGTDVLMADGSVKVIEDVRLGDEVLATDPVSGKSGKRKVTRLIVTEADKHFNELTISTEDGPKKLTATHEHPFWSPSEKQWVEAGKLKPGMRLLTDDGTTLAVAGNRAFAKHARTYNLTVDDLHTYYVLAGETPVLVHNSNGFCGVEVGNGASLDNLTGSERARIQNAADRIGHPISVVGSRSIGKAGPESDWDYVITGINSRTKHSVKSSLPQGAVELGYGRRYDIFTSELAEGAPYITFHPRG
ncbi:polymorphic toxin-type HINT domain-containing protein [Streptomyces sp. NBC_01794]|nr:polymorphic toxin-type HINT domain-containing protein [Streptomyces sp. NBC_01750]WSB02518.1 polymorphic toxin-type HINT domain-containing protein [Streptomyces sp. NBC_01794]WSD33220.1 polymorphic toxin-type HINT domain-containing protein [Streptomyces sp. NBC_01750]